MREVSRASSKKRPVCPGRLEWCIEARVAEQHDESESSSGPDKTEPEATETEQTEQVDAEASGADADSPSAAEEAEAAVVVASPTKKKKKKRALQDEDPGPSRDRNRRLREEIASGGRTKRGSAPRPATRQLEAGEIVDDAFARTSAAAGDWLKKNFAVVQWFIIAGIVAWVGYAIYSYRAGRAAEQASAKLTTAIRAEGARVGPADTKPDPQTGIVETRPAYPTDEARLKAAEQQYRAIADSGSTAAATFAKLGLATVLYDQGKYADAKVAYQAVKDSKLASQDKAVKGRALEGIGISLEGSGDKEGAGKAFGELANLDALGFNALGAYHQARLAFAAGNPEKAKELLKDAQKHLDALATPDSKDTKKSPFGGGPTSYLQQSVKDLQTRVDPSAVPAPSSGGLSAEQLQELQQQMGSPNENGSKGLSSEKLQELLKRIGSKGAPVSPAPPASAP
jgi:predicted negative regulator of RcsB-dependent stress response